MHSLDLGHAITMRSIQLLGSKNRAGTGFDARELITDIIDILTGIEPGSALDEIRRTREQARDNAQRSFEVLFEPEDPGTFSLAERYAVAAYTVVLQASASPAARFYICNYWKKRGQPRTGCRGR